jgi:hypothetical protein
VPDDRLSHAAGADYTNISDPLGRFAVHVSTPFLESAAGRSGDREVGR